MKFIKQLTFLLVLFSTQLFSQVIVTDLSDNILIIKENQKQFKKSNLPSTAIKLPFLDDFSGSKVFPNDILWADSNVFINGNYPVNPFTINVATFDALDSTGRIYPNASTVPFKADYLTSEPIRLDSIFGNDTTLTQVTDSIYLSFFYQPQGIGNAPEKNDSLVLQFYNKYTNTWRRVWSDTGTTYQRFYQRYGTSFKQVIIPIMDTAYFKDGFKFRFYNFASLTNSTMSGSKSNCDQWHVDYIYLNNKRRPSDTTYKDIAITKEGNSFLKNYYAMPWRQYKINPANETKSQTDFYICNLDKVTNSTNFYYKIYNNNTLQYYSDTLTNLPSINPHITINAPLPIPNTVFPIDNNDNATFDIKKIITDGTANLIQSNDTVDFYQDFNNYYAYDDGNPEAGIGTNRANSKLAYKFNLNTPDTLRAVQIYFNTTLYNANQRNFKLIVWKSINPEVILYSKGGYIPVFGEDNNRYHYYRLETPLVLSDTFYVGVQQTTDDMLNIGLDYNNNSMSKAYFNLSSGWEQVTYSGAIMMRPILGSIIPPDAGIDEPISSFANLSVYPNPAKNNQLHIELPDNIDKSNIQLQVFDIYGRNLFTDKYISVLNITDYSNGMYFIRLTNTTSKETYTSKVLITK